MGEKSHLLVTVEFQQIGEGTNQKLQKQKDGERKQRQRS